MKQSLLAGLFVAVVVFCVDWLVHRHQLLSTIDMGALASTSFLLLAMPNAAVTHARCVIGGYVLSILVGILFHYLLQLLFLIWPQTMSVSHWLFAGFAVSLAMWVMLVFRMEHPPAASMSLAIVIEVWQPALLCLVLLAVIVLCGFRFMARQSLVNLI